MQPCEDVANAKTIKDHGESSKVVETDDPTSESSDSNKNDGAKAKGDDGESAKASGYDTRGTDAGYVGEKGTGATGADGSAGEMVPPKDMALEGLWSQKLLSHLPIQMAVVI